MLTYSLFKTQSMLLSAKSQKAQPDAHLHTVQNPHHALVSTKLEEPAKCSLTYCSKSRACSCQQKAGKASRWWLTFCSNQSMLLSTTSQEDQMLTYILFKTQSMPLSATSRKGQPDADLHPVQNPEHAVVKNKQNGPTRCWLTACSKPRACSSQQQAARASHMLTYILFKPQSMLLSATSRKSQSNADLQPVKNPQHALVRNKEERPARCWLTSCLKPRACACQHQRISPSKISAYILL